ncbi:hypothetical protein [Colwellia echini]|uniref:Uncharacterized protein n=1 Tax=Colwellia echini TaxID=1982103 RepID=A0ABY3N0W1_9GAMM|nr:hypothetical protein [Colwellia echini]TYK66882.1 hypothetical protein CWS31_003615 [Colwellia echini]
MNKTALPTLIGAFTSLLAIWVLHTLLMVNDCVDQGGKFEHSTGKCLLENGQIYDSGIAEYALALYFVVGFSVSFFVAKLVRKLLNIRR